MVRRNVTNYGQSKLVRLIRPSRPTSGGRTGRPLVVFVPLVDCKLQFWFVNPGQRFVSFVSPETTTTTTTFESRPKPFICLTSRPTWRAIRQKRAPIPCCLSIWVNELGRRRRRPSWWTTKRGRLKASVGRCWQTWNGQGAEVQSIWALQLGPNEARHTNDESISRVSRHHTPEMAAN